MNRSGEDGSSKGDANVAEEASDTESSQISLPRSYTLPREFKYTNGLCAKDRSKAMHSRFYLPSTNSSDGWLNFLIIFDFVTFLFYFVVVLFFKGTWIVLTTRRRQTRNFRYEAEAIIIIIITRTFTRTTINDWITARTATWTGRWASNSNNKQFTSHRFIWIHTLRGVRINCN